MIKKIFLALLFTLGILVSGRVFGQTANDSIGLNRVINNYNTAIGQQSRLFNGPEYEYYDPIIKGNAYVFEINAFSPGSVNYDGITYSNVPMMYDLNKDEVVVLLYNHFSKYTLIKDRVQDFSLLNHHFIHIRTDSVNQPRRVSPGYYDQLYAGKNVDVLAKRSKSIQTITGNVNIETFFAASKTYYIKKADGYYSFGSQSSLLNILKDKKKELQKYIKGNKIIYRDNPEQAMASIAAYYDHLIN